MPAHARCSSRRSRPSRVRLLRCPSCVDAPRVTVATLTPDQRRASRIISGPVTLVAGETRLRVPRWRLAKLLDLPTMRFVGPAANAYFARLERTVDRSARDASFAVDGSKISVVPAATGLTLDVPRSVRAVLAAAERPANRVTALAFSVQQPKVTTAAAQAMGIKGTVGSYETVYGGDPNRIHNVQLVAHLVDNKLIAPGATFSFNGTTGERSAEKGFLEAPVIVNGELQTGLGGGVCQVSTTVFNAAYEAGLRITARTNHSLYISHYPLGRDATVNYPDTDLKFVNDTGHWLLLRTWVGPSSLTVALYGTPQHRKIETTSAPLARRCARSGDEDRRRHSEAGPGRRRRRRDARAVDVCRAQGLFRRWQAPLRRRRGTRATGRRRRSCASARRSRRRRRRRPPPRPPRPRPAPRRPLRRRRRRRLRTSDRLAQPGRHARRPEVPASTVACAVQPSAISSAPRSIAYS